MKRSIRSTRFLVVVAVMILGAGGLIWSLSPSASDAVRIILRGLSLGIIVGLVTLGITYGRPTAKRVVASTPRLSLSRAYLIPGEVPPPPVYFMGQKGPLDRLSRVLESANGRDRRPFIVLIHGEAGVGKSGFARKLSADVAKHFKDGILYASMTGATVGSDRLDNVLGDLVDSLQGPGDAVPKATARRRAELTRLSRRKRRVLYVLDDVVDAEAAEWVLPSSSRAVVVITSRDDLRLKGTVERHELQPLSVAESDQLLRALLGNPGPDEADDGALARVVASAAGYPLALNLAARAIANQGLWALPEITADLPTKREEGDLTKARARMLDLSFTVLSRTQQEVLLSLAWLPEPVFVPWMAQALSQIPGEDEVWLVCERLADERLLERITPDATGVVRFRMPDRVEEYVRARAAKRPDHADRQASAREHLTRAMTDRRTRGLDQVPDMLNRGKVARALDEARGALADAVDVDDTVRGDGPPSPLVQRAYAMIAEILAELGGLDDAIDVATAHLDPRDGRDRTPPEPDLASAQLRRTFGRLLRRAWRLDDAVRELDAALAVARALEQVDEQISTLRELAIVESMRTEKPDTHVDRALAHLAEADGLIESSVNGDYLRCRIREARAIVRLNDVVNHGGAASQLREAVADLDRAAELLPPGYRLWHSWFAYHKARVLIRQADEIERDRDIDLLDHNEARRLRREARQLAQTALDEFASMAHRYGAARCRLEIGRTFAVERPEAALPLLEEARETFIFCGDRWIEAQTALVLAQVRTRVRLSREEALREIDFAEGVFEAVRDRPHLAEARTARAALLLEERQ